MILAPMSNFRLSVRLEVLIKNWQLVYWFCCCFLHQPFSVLIGSISVQRSLASSYSSAMQPFLKSPSFFFSFLHLIFSRRLSFALLYALIAALSLTLYSVPTLSLEGKNFYILFDWSVTQTYRSFISLKFNIAVNHIVSHDTATVHLICFSIRPVVPSSSIWRKFERTMFSSVHINLLHSQLVLNSRTVRGSVLVILIMDSELFIVAVICTPAGNTVRNNM